MQYFISIILCFVSHISIAQYSAIILDSVTYEAIPYVHIISTSNQQGVLSDEAGVFEFNLNSKSTIQLSHIGYETKTTPVSVNETDDIDTIFLHPKSIELTEAIVEPLQKGETITFVHKKPKRTRNYFRNRKGGSFQLVKRIDSACDRCIIEHVNFHVQSSTNNIVRLRFYDQNKDGLPNQDIANQSIIKNITTNGWNSISVQDYQLVVPAHFFVGLEFLDKDEAMAIGLAANNNSEPLTFIKNLGKSWWLATILKDKKDRPLNMMINVELRELK